MVLTMLSLHTRTPGKTSPLGVISHSLHHVGHDMLNNRSTLRQYNRRPKDNHRQLLLADIKVGPAII